MKSKMVIIGQIILIYIFIMLPSTPFARDSAIIVDHESSDLSAIPENWISVVQSQIKWHYAHTSHGGQLLTGLDLIEGADGTYDINISDSALPTTANTLCIFNGQENETYITPELYWATLAGINDTKTVLNNNPTINVSQWSFCTQLDSKSEAYVTGYLDSIETLEEEYPNVTFVYMTGNAQATGSSGYNRYLRNEQIREYCRTHNKVLYDFADLDCWWLNDTGVWEFSTYTYNDQEIPVQHPHYNGSESGHTTLESCMQKGNATWWLLAEIAGWGAPSTQLNYGITIDAECNAVNDLGNQLGAAISATNDYDAGFDIAEAPIPPNDYISLYFPHPEWSHPLGDKFSADIRTVADLRDSMQVWHFNIATDETGDMSLTFTFDDVANRPVILTDFQHNTHFPIIDGGSYTFTIEDTLMQFELAVGDTTPPDIAWTSPTNFEILQSDSILPLSWNYADGFQVDSIFLGYQLNGGMDSQSLQSLGSIGSAEWTLPHWTGINEVYLAVTAKDFAGNTSTDIINEPILVVGDSLSSQVNQGWSLWGAPVAPYDSTMMNNLEDDLSDWVTFDYRDGGYSFNGALAAGKGYWLGTTSAGNLDVIGEVLSNVQQVSINSGWNLVSNPLVVALAKSDLTFDDGHEIKSWSDAVSAGWITDILYGWNGTGLVSADTLQPWKGYWLGATQTLNMNFEYNPSMDKSSTEQITHNWVVLLKCYTLSHGFDEITMLGTATDATNGYDIPYDVPKPPSSPMGEVRLVIPHPEWNYLLGDDFAVDVRNEIAIDSSRTWNLHGSTEEDVKLTWEANNVYDNIQLDLILSDQTVLDLATLDTLVLTPTQFQSLAVRATKLPTEIISNSKLPTETVLQNNYPNPFNPTTHIQYSLKDASYVRLVIYDLRGTEIRQLVHTYQQPGWYNIVWDGQNNLGVNVSNGVYLYQMESDNYTETKKMILLK